MQQIPFIDIFIDLFKSALHLSGDKLARLQEHFLTVYTALYQKLYIQSKNAPEYMQSESAPEDGRVCRPKHVELI